jgi:predicted dehydrogenase
MARVYKVVICGCGGIAGAKYDATKGRSDIEYVGLVDIDIGRARKRAADFHLDGVPVGTDLSAMIEKTRPDIVFDCTVPEAHAPVTINALERGCHVLGEKPLADTMENARRMIAAAKKAGKVYAVTQNRRHQAEIRALAKFLASGELGRVTTVQSTFLLGAHFGGFRDRMEHVLLLDMAIHSFDQARLVMGADARTAYCHEWNPAGSWYDHDASAVAIFEMTGGIVYTYQGSWCAEGLNTSWECDWRIMCERGSVAWDGGSTLKAVKVVKTAGFISELTPVTIPVTPIAPEKSGQGGVVDEFIAALEEGRDPETVCTDNIKSLAMVHAAIGSADEGRKVDVER